MQPAGTAVTVARSILAAALRLAATAAGRAASVAAAPPEAGTDAGADQLLDWAQAAVDAPDEPLTVEILTDRSAPDAAGAVARTVARLGGRVTGRVPGHLVQAAVPLGALDALRAAPGVGSVRRPLAQDLALGAVAAAGGGAFAQAIAGEEIAHVNADAWHLAGHTGAGVKIGIVDGFDGTSWDAAVVAGDLPPVDTPTHTFCRLAGENCNVWGTGIRHGVAVAGIVHEVAPDAELFLATALTASDLVAAVDWFVANDVTIVNRSLGAALDGAGDGTGPLAAVADYAVAAGISWFNSAGNAAGRDGRRGDYYRAPFTDTDGDGWHEFVNPSGPGPAPPGGPFEDLSMRCTGSLLSSLRWSDWGDLAMATDYDLFVFSSRSSTRFGPAFDTAAALADPQLVAASYAAQGSGGGPPLEHLSDLCNDSTVYVAIRTAAANNGTGNDTLELMAEADLETWSNAYSALYPINDSANPGVFAIGAVDAGSTIAYYSAEGPTNDGRIKPDFTARSGIQTGVPTLTTFNGTSASSPAAAGLAALVVGAGRADSPTALRQWLLANAAIDRGTCGPDTRFGYGELILPDPNAAPNPPGDPYVPCAARFVALAPTRIFDSRESEPGPGPKGRLGSESSLDLPVAGVGAVPADAVAAVLNVTVTEPDAAGFVTVSPSGQPQPLASAVNVIAPGQTRPALVTVPVGTGGRVTLFTKSAAHLVVDLAGYYLDADDAGEAAGRFVALTPQRLFDTRDSEPAPGPKGQIGARQTVDVAVLGQAGVPAAGVAAVVVNLTGTDPPATGFLTVFPTGAAVPLASTVNLAGPGDTAANLAIVPLGAGGQISTYSSHGAHALADVVGYITDTTAPAATTGLFVPRDPARAFDTREGTTGRMPAGATITRQIAGVAGVPLQARAVVLTMTGTESPLGYLTAWPGGPRPLASTLNLAHQPLDTRANGAMLRLGPAGELAIYSKPGGHVLADVTGFYLW